VLAVAAAVVVFVTAFFMPVKIVVKSVLFAAAAASVIFETILVQAAALTPMHLTNINRFVAAAMQAHHRLFNGIDMAEFHQDDIAVFPENADGVFAGAENNAFDNARVIRKNTDGLAFKASELFEKIFVH